MHPTQATLADFLFSPRSTWNHVYRLLYSYAVLLSLRISEFPMHIFCPQNTQELPKKHHGAGPPEQLHTDALSQIDLRTDARHCEDCKEVRLCRRTTQTAFWKIWVGICAWLGEKCAPPPPRRFKTLLRRCVRIWRGFILYNFWVIAGGSTVV